MLSYLIVISKIKRNTLNEKIMFIKLIHSEYKILAMLLKPLFYKINFFFNYLATLLIEICN